MSDVEVIPVSDALGVEVRGIDLADVEGATFATIRRAWFDHLVLLFRGQDITDAGVVAFSRRFGELDLAPPNETGKAWLPDNPEILVISNVIEEGAPIGSLGSDEASWHTDMNYMETPAKASCLYALEVPESGGDTEFCNMYAAYEALPDDLRARVEALTLKHDSSLTSTGALRAGWEQVTDVDTCPGAIHPMVHMHPETGRKALYLGRRRNAYICELTVEESEVLLDAIWGYATREAHTWQHSWCVGDMLIWDNRCTMHRRDSFAPDARRVMHRTQIKGEKPIPAAE